MEEKDKKQFAVIMWGIAEDFGGTLSKNGLKVRYDAMKDYSIEQISQAGTWLLKNRKDKFPPVPTTKETLEAIEKISGALPLKTKAEIEADKVLRKLKFWGSEAKPLFYDETTKYLMTHRWTFDQIGKMNQTDLKWFRKDFVESYQDMAEHEAVKLIENNDRNLQIPVSKLKELL